MQDMGVTEPLHSSSCFLLRNESAPNLISFFLFGLINNFAYVVFLSAAGDILPKNFPAATVLLAEMIPIIVSQGVAPFFIERVPFWIRIMFMSLSSCASFLIVAFSPNVEIVILGIAIGSVSSGFGEITFMALSSYYHADTVSLYSSGTGGAGIFGSLAYLAMTTWLRLQPFETLLILSPLPVTMSLAYIFLLRKPDGINTCFDCSSQSNHHQQLQQDEKETFIGPPKKYFTFLQKLKLQLRLFQYTGPLFLVYFGEYTINTGLSPVILYPNDPIFTGNEYKYYSFIYQVGVFISRSSASFVRIKNLWLLASLQILNMVFLFLVALLGFIPYIWIIFIIIFFEGLVGGAIFVNTFYKVAEEIEPDLKEFCMSSISFWYSCGILLAGVVAANIQIWLKNKRFPDIPNVAPMPEPDPSPPYAVPQPDLPPSPSPFVPLPEDMWK